jgi:pilus assembly protein CpaF
VDALGSAIVPSLRRAVAVVTEDLLRLVLEHDEIADLDPAQRRLALRSLVLRRRAGGDARSMIGTLADSIDGFGPLSEVMADCSVTDVMINGPREVWVERDGHTEPAKISWPDDASLTAFVDRLLGRAGARVDMSQPIADARLVDGSRIHVVVPPIAPEGPLVSIRKWPDRRFTLEDLAARAMFDRDTMTELRSAVVARKSILVSGATATGKTTLLNALLGAVPREERIVVVEEARELAPECEHWVSLMTRSANLEGRGEIDMLLLVRTALRMRPDRLVIGEVRGREALAALGALSTGHAGSMMTVHAMSASDALSRLVSLALQAASGDSEATLRTMAERAVDVVVHLERRAGARRVVDVLAGQ